MGEFFTKLFDGSDFPARWHCGNWSEGHGYLHIVSDGAIFLAYTAIGLLLLSAVRQRRDLPFPKLVLLFAAFILACGLTHLNDAIVFWHPYYRFAGVTKLGTALVSVATVLALSRVLPRLRELRTPAQLEAEVATRGAELVETQRANAFMAAIVESCEDAIISTDLEGTILTWNPAAERLYGYSAVEAIGQHKHLLSPADLRTAVDERLASVARGEQLERVEIAHQHADGTRIAVSLTISPVRTHDGELVGASLLVRDVRAERRQRKELEDAIAELQTFSYSVTHDLRAPLRAMDGFSKSLLRRYADALDDKGRHYCERISAGARRMGDLIDGILALSRVSGAELDVQDVDLSAVARDVVKELDRGAAATIDIADGMATRADPRLLRAVLQNLIENGLKFSSTTEDARIEVGVEGDGHRPVYFVRDNGEGFDMEYADQLFQPFKRLHTDEQFSGLGIGLATVRRIVSRHGGRIWAESAPGKGATFRFTLDPRPAAS